MSLVVEDGTGLATAESIISVAEANTYHSNRGNSSWLSLSILVKEQLLRKANDYLRQNFGTRWKGTLVEPLQGCDWPRHNILYVVPPEMPAQVKNAVAELAFKANTVELNPDTTQVIKSEKIGPMTTTYDQYSPQKTLFVSVEATLLPFLTAGGGVSVRLTK